MKGQRKKLSECKPLVMKCSQILVEPESRLWHIPSEIHLKPFTLLIETYKITQQ